MHNDVLPGKARKAFPVSSTPQLAATYDLYDPDLLELLLRYVDYLEITPDAAARKKNGKYLIDRRLISQLQEVSDQVKLVAHGVGLSIGTYEAMNEVYLQILDDLVAHVPLQWHSEHLCFTKAGGEELMTMVPLPRTEEMLEVLTTRIDQLQQRYQIPFLMENIAQILPPFGNTFSSADFLNRLCAASGCGLILDTYNLLCDKDNHGVDTGAFLDELDLANVWEIHLAGGPVNDGFRMDVHCDRTNEDTRRLTGEVLEKEQCKPYIITYEILPEMLPRIGMDGLEQELKLLKETFCTP